MHVKLSTTFPVAVLPVSVALLLALLSVEVRLGHAAETFSPARVAVYFSPSGGGTDAVVREVNAGSPWASSDAHPALTQDTPPPIFGQSA